ncbi:MAG: hypothetical protein DWP98_07855 [Bacteroidetes bacterium]|nr:MAG: hypothetical protein DWP98_07855 [Bacteroidota bacterium]MBL1145880.1 hypothetical protein [Bacteroidota bacterium]MCB0801932.1 hypothetical protein [Flavobacteriales bacterium]NOG58674.1 hypothetical protein [Bacteroidota bacterium]
MDSINRSLDYYTDFTGSDTYVYLLKFNKDVAVSNKEVLTKVKNKFGIYHFELTQLDSRSIKVSSYFLADKSVVEAKAIGNVVDVYSAINNIQDDSLKLLIKE